MILDSIENLSCYTSLHPAFKKLFDFINSTDFKAIKPGKYELNGTDLYYMPQEVIGKLAEDVELEAHRRYIDLQIPLSASETFGWKNTTACQQVTTPYSETKDCVLFKDIPDTYLTVHPGQAIILFPDDAHAPCISQETFTKVVFKIRID